MQILGYIFIALVLLVLIAVLVVLYFFRRIKQIGRMYEPVQLEVDPDPAWIKNQKVQAIIREFGAIGFLPHRVYKETNLKVKPMFLANSSRTQFGEIYHTPQEIVTGFCADTEDGMSLNVSTSRLADAFAIKPNKITEGYPGADVASLYGNFKKLIADQPLKVIDDEGFDAFLQDQMNKEMQGRYDAHELPLWQDGEEVFVQRWRKHHKSEKDLHLTYEALSGESMEKIAQEISLGLGQSEELSAATHSKYEYSFIAYNPRFHKNGFCTYLEVVFTCREDIQTDRIKKLAMESTTTASFFDAFRLEFPQLNLKKFHAVTEPVEADLWGYDDQEEDQSS